jgi:hypothetical protein
MIIIQRGCVLREIDVIRTYRICSRKYGSDPMSKYAKRQPNIRFSIAQKCNLIFLEVLKKSVEDLHIAVMYRSSSGSKDQFVRLARTV